MELLSANASARCAQALCPLAIGRCYVSTPGPVSVDSSQSPIAFKPMGGASLN